MKMLFRVPGVRCQARRGCGGFTMIEIALCLAIIGFALVAIIGVLPVGLGVQRENREETIINQEAAVWMDAIRSGARRYDDLTNYVLGITNFVSHFQMNGTNVTQLPGLDVYTFTFNSSTKNGAATAPSIPLKFSPNIIGLLSKPKIEWTDGARTTFDSNYVFATVRALSGSAAEKLPQTNLTVLADSFTYKMIVEIVPYVPVDPGSIDVINTNTMNAQQIIDRVNRAHLISILRTNSHDIRLTFRWPYLPTGEPGNGRRSFRALNGGVMQPVPASPADQGLDLYFFQPSTYVQATRP